MILLQNMTNKLSVITINKNNSKGLIKTIKSVTSQSFKEFQYIIIDGASTDNSLQIIKDFSNADIQNLIWLSEPDQGIYEAMNKGIQRAYGDYLLFLNSGDFFVNCDVLRDLFSHEHAADFLIGRCNISKNGRVIHTTTPPEVMTFGYLYHTGIPHQATFIKRELFQLFGLYDLNYKYNADIAFFFKTIVFGNRSSESLSIIVSDYDANGLSEQLSKTDLFQKELQEIYSDSRLKLFVPDYDQWNIQQKEKEVLHWVQSKKNIFLPLAMMFKIAKFLSRKKHNKMM